MTNQKKGGWGARRWHKMKSEFLQLIQKINRGAQVSRVGHVHNFLFRSVGRENDFRYSSCLLNEVPFPFGACLVESSRFLVVFLPFLNFDAYVGFRDVKDSNIFVVSEHHFSRESCVFCRDIRPRNVDKIIIKNVFFRVRPFPIVYPEIAWPIRNNSVWLSLNQLLGVWMPCFHEV